MNVALKQRIKFTYDDYKTLPESETLRYELLDGELVMVPSPSIRHQRVSRNLFEVLNAYVRESGRGEVLYAPCDVYLGINDVVQPDLIYISAERSDIIGEEEIQGAPDLVVEILSPSSAPRDRVYKRTLYARYGVREYWLVDPQTRTVEVLRLGGRGFRKIGLYGEGEDFASPLLPGLEISVADVFRGV